MKIDDSDSDEDDAMMAIIAARGRRPKTIRARPDHLNVWDDHDFFIRFRLTKVTATNLFVRIRHMIESRTERNHAVTPMDRLLITLRFYALGTMLIALGDFGGIHKSTAGRIISMVTRAIASLRPQVVTFPSTDDEKQLVKEGFYNAARFPQVLGAIDCTHIKIQSTGGNIAEDYRNRKNYFSLNVQTICDARLRILDITARWPGSAHDRTIYNNSTIKARFETGEMGDGILLGDSGYTLSPFLIVPIRNPVTPEEILFNESQIRTRSIVERSYGVWKRRFPVLSLGIRVKLRGAMAIIIACSVVHNLACDMGEPEPPPDPDQRVPLDLDRDQIRLDVGPGHARGEGRTRESLIQYFRGLQRQQ